MKNSWRAQLTSNYQDGSSLTNSTTATSLIPAAEKFVLPSNIFFPGVRLHLSAAGRISTAAATPGTLTLDLRFGSTVVWNGGATPTLQTSKTTVSWKLEADLVCRAYGASTGTTLLGIGTLTSDALAAGSICMPFTTPAAGSGFDCTASQQADFFATFSVASASNIILLHDFALELLN